MKSFMAVPICSLIYIVILSIIYFYKPRIKSIENSVYKSIIIVNIIGLILEILCYAAVEMVDKYYILSMFILRGYVVYIFIWSLIFNIYVFMTTLSVKQHINQEKYYQKLKIISCIIGIVFSVCMFLLPIRIYNEGAFAYTYGPSVDLLLILCGIIITIWVIKCIKNIKNIKEKKYIPIIACIIVLILVFVVQSTNRAILIATAGHSLIIFLMYFTIENPDLQLLREFHKAREYANNLNTEKSEFLFNMAGEIKTPISVINRISKEVLMQDDINVIKSKVNDIKYSSNNLLELVNKVLDINSLEKRKVSVRESKYNTTNLFKGIESQTELKLNNDLVKFRTNYDKSIPNELYGDSVRIRQIINTLLENAIKYTKEGFIELSVNSIVKHDICRLVITVEDSGVGMTQDIVEHLFDKELEKIEEIDNPKMDLGLVKTLLDLIGGTIIVNSELNHGTKFTIVLDQKVVNHKKNKTIEAVEKYEEMYLNNKKVMCVINDEALSKKINTLFKKYQLDIEVVKLGQSCLEKVRAGEKFDLIIIEEHLEKLSSENTLAKLKSIQGFKTPVILLTDIKDINEKEEYLKLGFTEIVTLPLKKEQVEELVNNYIND